MVVINDQQAVMFLPSEQIERARGLLTQSFGLNVQTRALKPSWSDKSLNL